MVSFDNFNIVCSKCGETLSNIGVSSTYGGDAAIFAYCPKCKEREVIVDTIKKLDKQLEE